MSSAFCDIGFIFILDWLDGKMSDKGILQMDPRIQLCNWSYTRIIKMNNT